jgi:ribosome-associated protein
MRGSKSGEGEPIMQITTEFIKLDSFLKAENAVSSGGEAKVMIAEGYISVNGEVELRRGRKLYPGDIVVFGERKFLIESA